MSKDLAQALAKGEISILQLAVMAKTNKSRRPPKTAITQEKVPNEQFKCRK